MATAERWIVTADGRRAQVFGQMRAGTSLQQVFAAALDQADEERTAPRDRAARAHDSVGPGRHAMDAGREPHEEAEKHFLDRVEKMLVTAHADGRFERLVLFAPPRALGLLRAGLQAKLGDALEFSKSLDIVAESPEQVHDRLRAAGMR